MSGSELRRSEKFALKAASRQLTKCNGGLDGAAAACRAKRSTLAEYCDNSRLDRFMPIDVVAELEREIGEAIVTKELMRLHGKSEEPERSIEGELSSMGARINFELAQFLEVAVEMDNASRLTINDIRSMSHRVNNILQVAHRVKDGLDTMLAQRMEGTVRLVK